MRRRAAALGALAAAVLLAGAAQPPAPSAPAAPERVVHRGREALRVVTRPGEERLVPLPLPEFGDGVIELEIAGEPSPDAGPDARGFVGIAFRVSDDARRYEAVYMRPTNARADDPQRRKRTLQYVSQPDFPWHRLRAEHPGVYESYADTGPGEWTRLRLEVTGATARLYVNGAREPALVVNDLKLGADARGGVALWVGPGAVAHLARQGGA